MKQFKRFNSILFDLIFPTYMLCWVFPLIWIIAIPGNFIIDSAVLLIVLKINRAPMSVYKRSIVKIWLLGFLADFIGSCFLFAVRTFSYYIFMSTKNNAIGDFSWSIDYDPIGHPGAFLVTILGIAIAGFFIYFFNMRFSLKSSELDVRTKRAIALTLAIVTAPYIFLVPVSFFGMS